MNAPLRFGALAAIFVPLLLGACAPQGDFGRPRDNAVNDSLLPAAGSYLAALREEPSSGFPMTDAEKDLRRLGYRLAAPAHADDRWNQFFAEMRRTRLGPPQATRPDPHGYCETLIAEARRSAKSRFHRIIDDMRADRARIAPFFAKADEVAEADRVRRGALTYRPDVSAGEIRNANDRVAENLLVVAIVRESLADRVIAYRCALHRLVVATPEPEAVLAERELAEFEADVAALNRPRRASPAEVTVAPRDGRFHPVSPPTQDYDGVVQK